jgi:hypothetical protein
MTQAGLIHKIAGREPGSFRDPSGFVFTENGTVYRAITSRYCAEYDQLMSSGLHSELVDKRLIVPHEEVADFSSLESVRDISDLYQVIQPQRVPFISYPYEWSFSQIQDAARLTLEIQKIALKYDMSLKDSSAYNIQFVSGNPIFIDTLSFETYVEGKPWVAYRQFCEHFLAPLALASYCDVRLTRLLRTYIDGIPLDLASKLLPTRTRFRAGLLMHVHLHAKSQTRHSDDAEEAAEATTKRQPTIKMTALQGIIESLDRAVKRLTWMPADTEWGDYYSATNYSGESLDHKKLLVAKYVGMIEPTPRLIWDLGANTGVFSEIAAVSGADVVAFDVDPTAVERGYIAGGDGERPSILPLMIDLTNPSPGIGWAHRERAALMDRGPADAVLALALVHHLAISNNVPLPELAIFFQQICRCLIIEHAEQNDMKRIEATSGYYTSQYLPDYSKFYRWNATRVSR